MLSQAHSMLDRKRFYDSDRIAFLTLFDPNVERPQLHHEVRNLLLRRPRITIICKPGTTLGAIKAIFTEYGWNETTYNQWLENNGKGLLPRGSEVSDDAPIEERKRADA